MDDILVLSPTRWRLRRAVATLGLAGRTIRPLLARLRRFHEQKKTEPEGAVDLGEYVTPWLRWTRAGLSEFERMGSPVHRPVHGRERCHLTPVSLYLSR